MAAAHLVTKLNRANEDTWLLLANLSDQLLEPQKSLAAYENVLRHNPLNFNALTQIAQIYQCQQQYPKAIEYYQRVVERDYQHAGQPMLGEVWASLGHCYLLTDELKEAYAAYQRALYSSQAAKDSNLWYGIGILYDKCGSFDLAEEVFCHVLKIAPDYPRKEEVLFRLGRIYKHEGKYDKALECFSTLVDKAPPPLMQSDVMFQIGIVFELSGQAEKAKEMYEQVLEENPKRAKIITQLGWLYHQEDTPFHNVDTAIEFMKTSVEADPSDPQPWYLLGRCYMSQKEYKNAYSAYQQAVYRDEMNPSYWCSIGVLYYQINQFRDALDAYSRSICLNPAQSEVWYDLGTLYESCKQLPDAFDAYSKAAELDPSNTRIAERLIGLKNAIKLEESGGVPRPASSGNIVPNVTSVPQSAGVSAGRPIGGVLEGSVGPTLAKLADTVPSEGEALRPEGAGKSREASVLVPKMNVKGEDSAPPKSFQATGSGKEDTDDDDMQIDEGAEGT